MESKYNRYISNKRKSLATSNKQGFSSEGGSFGAPLVLLWCSFGGSEWIRRRFEGDSEWYATANVCGKGMKLGIVTSRRCVQEGVNV